MTDIPGTSETNATATPDLGYSGVLSSADDIDWIELQVPVYGTYVIVVTGDAVGRALDAALFSRYEGSTIGGFSQSLIATGQLGTSVGYTTVLYADDPNGNFVRYLALSGQAGDYTVELVPVAEYLGNPVDSNGYDPALGIGSGPALAAGTSGSGNLETSGDLDVFATPVSAGHSYRVTFTIAADALPEGVHFDPAIELFEGSTYLNGGFHATESNGQITFEAIVTAPTDDTLFSMATNYDSLHRALLLDCAYDILVEDLGTGAPNANHDAATATPLVAGTTTEVPVGAYLSEFWYEFEAVAGHSYTLVIGDNVTSRNIIVTAENGDLIDGRPQTNGSGTVILTSDALSADGTLRFSLELSGDSFDTDGTLPITIIDTDLSRDLVDGAASTVIAAGDSITEEWHWGDHDNYRLDYLAGETYTITVTYPPSYYDGQSHRFLFLESNDLVNAWSSAGWEAQQSSTGGWATYSFVALEDGSIDLGLYAPGTVSAQGAYFIDPYRCVNDMSFDYTITVSQTIEDDRAQVGTDLVGPALPDQVTQGLDNGHFDRDGYAFEVVEGQSYTIVISGQPGEIALYSDVYTGGGSYAWPTSYVETGADLPYPTFSPLFDEERALLSPEMGNVTRVGDTLALTFTAEYTGTYWAEFVGTTRDLIAGGAVYDIFIGTTAVAGTLFSSLGLPSDGDDDLVGTAGNDAIDGGAGRDTIHGFAGADTLQGSAGNDWLDGGAGNDLLIGGRGNDVLIGNLGRDTADYSGALAVRVDLRLESRQDTGGAGADILRGIENVIGSNRDDILLGNAADNALVGNAGADLLAGAAGNDTLDGGDGDDRLAGGSDNDLLLGGDGFDTALYSGAVAVTVDLALDGWQETGLGRDRLLWVEALSGSAAGDRLAGDDAANRLAGLEGDDDLQGRSSNDTLEGSAGADRLNGGAGADLIDGGAGVDTAVYGGRIAAHVDLALSGAQDTGQGRDRLIGIERLEGGSGGDWFGGNAAANMLSGLAGNDTLTGRAGNDWLFGGEGDDRLYGGADADRIDGGAGADLLAGGTGDDRFVFRDGYGRDVITDFGSGEDMILLGRDLGWTTEAAVLRHTSQDGEDVVIRFGDGDVLTLRNTTVAEIEGHILLI